MESLYPYGATIISFLMTSCQTWKRRFHPLDSYDYTYEPLGDHSQASKPQLRHSLSTTMVFLRARLLLARTTRLMVSHGDHAHYFTRKTSLLNRFKQLRRSWPQQPVKPSAAVKTLNAIHAMPAMRKRLLISPRPMEFPRRRFASQTVSFVFNNPDQAYDPTHYPPLCCARKEHVRIHSGNG